MLRCCQEPKTQHTAPMRPRSVLRGNERSNMAENRDALHNLRVARLKILRLSAPTSTYSSLSQRARPRGHVSRVNAHRLSKIIKFNARESPESFSAVELCSSFADVVVSPSLSVEPKIKLRYLAKSGPQTYVDVICFVSYSTFVATMTGNRRAPGRRD